MPPHSGESLGERARSFAILMVEFCANKGSGCSARHIQLAALLAPGQGAIQESASQVLMIAGEGRHISARLKTHVAMFLVRHPRGLLAGIQVFQSLRIPDRNMREGQSNRARCCVER
jgi:hypothetical protein